MKFYQLVIYCFFIALHPLSASELTISSYNCGGLSDHYDYLRAASMEKLLQERYRAEPESMALNEKIQKLAVKMLFSSDGIEKVQAQQEWDQRGYQYLFERLTAAPTDKDSPNTIWYNKANAIITPYKVRPVIIHDEEVKKMLHEHLNDVSRTEDTSTTELLQKARRIMATRAFAHHLNYDIICLQEADYLDHSLFPSNYEVLFADTSDSKNGIAWKKERFDLVQSLDISGRAVAVQLRDKESNTTILVASGHLTGCNPYRVEKDPITGDLDSAKGDTELQTIIDLFDRQEVDVKIIGMDSNVTSLHPRLHILKDGGYQIDSENYLEPTCTNPYQVLNTRIDWIALKSNSDKATISNIPVLSIGLNSIQTNMSDHKPIAAKIDY
jgi:hypothetical protein